MDQYVSDSESETSEVGSHPLRYISPEVLGQLAHLNLNGRLSSKKRKFLFGGAYGDISRTKCTVEGRGPVKVAVKCLRFYLKDDIKMLFEKEIYVWSKLQHENILPLLGYDFDDVTGYPLLVSEWMVNGSAWTYVKANPEADVIHLMLGISRGLAYLHQRGVVHSDIKSDNVLVSDSGEARICDFGCSRIITASRSLANVTSGVKGTSRYLAHELLTDHSAGHTMQTDVWAFGMTMFELLTQTRPYEGRSDNQALAALQNYELPSFPQDIPTKLSVEGIEALQILCFSCWKQDVSERPSMRGVTIAFEVLSRLRIASSNGRPESHEEHRAQPHVTHKTSLDDCNESQSDQSSLPMSVTHSLSAQFDHHSKRAEDLKAVVEVYRAALALYPEGHPNWLMSLNDLANALSGLFEHNRSVEDLEEATSLYRAALEAFPESHPSHSSSLINLASSTFARFRHQGRTEDLENAIVLYRAALGTFPEGHLDRLLLLNALANAMAVRFKQNGRFDDLEESIKLRHSALTFRPEGHPDRSALLIDFANSLLARFEHHGEAEDLEEAIVLYRAALVAFPEGHPDSVPSLTVLANALLTRFERGGMIEDLNQSIKMHRSILVSCPDDRSDWLASLNALANSLFIRFGCQGRTEDVEEAITLYRAVSTLSPDKYSDGSSSLSNLINSLLTRFKDSSGLSTKK